MKNYKHNKKAAQGIGTLIIFIALILVAAVAAAVLIQTASTLQSKSLDVGRQTQQKITTDIEVVQVFARDVSDSSVNGGTDNVSIVVRLGSGSAAVKLSDLLIKFDSSTGSQTVTTGGIGTNPTESLYAVDFIINGSNHNDFYLVEGDLAQLSFTLASGTIVNESESTTIRLIAKNGAVKPIDITTPAAMVEQTVYLYP